MVKIVYPKWSAVVIAAGLAVTMTACSSSSKSGTSPTTGTSGGATTSSSGSTDAGVAAATAFLQPYLSEATAIPITTALPSKPPAGKTVFYIGGSDPTVKEITDGMKIATTALGWNLKILSTDDPTAVSGLIQQALTQGANYIGYVAAPFAALSAGLAAAKAKNVPVFEMDDLEPAQGQANWIFSQIDGVNDWVAKGKINADYIIQKSGGKANILLVNVPAFGVLKLYEDTFKAEISKNCSGCTFAALDVPYTDITGGKVPAATVSYLRAHPKVNQLVYATGGFNTGLFAAAATAGIKLGAGGVQVTVQAPNDSDRQNILDGKEDAALATPNAYNGWLMVDAMVRQSVGASLVPNWTAVTPLLIQTKANLKSATAVYDGPTGYQDQFKKLWLVS